MTGPRKILLVGCERGVVFSVHGLCAFEWRLLTLGLPVPDKDMKRPQKSAMTELLTETSRARF